MTIPEEVINLNGKRGRVFNQDFPFIFLCYHQYIGSPSFEIMRNAGELLIVLYTFQNILARYATHGGVFCY
jgi:hypothetical protein